MPEKFFRFLPFTPSRQWYVKFGRAEAFPFIQYFRGETLPPEPLQLQLFNTKRIDILTGLAQGGVFVTERVVELLKKNKFTGWDLYPVHIATNQLDIPPIHGLVFKGRIAGNPFIIDPKLWDGTDFCTYTLGETPIVTARVFDAFQSEKITGGTWEPFKTVDSSTDPEK